MPQASPSPSPTPTGNVRSVSERRRTVPTPTPTPPAPQALPAREQGRLERARQAVLACTGPEACNREVLAKLNTLPGFSLDGFKAYLRRGADFYDGTTRVVDPEGKEFAKFHPSKYLDHIAERVEPWTYLKQTYLKNVGWKGWVTGKDSGIYRGGPLGRLNACDGMQTPVAQAEYEKMYSTLGGKPVHATLAYHWARIIEGAQGAELWVKFLEDDSITDPKVRNLATATPSEGVGVIEAARGHLIHHYVTDPNGIVTDMNLIVATTHNYAGINLSVRQAAKGLISKGQVDEGKLNMVEMAFRAYDPCMACATHALPGKMPLEVEIREADGTPWRTIKRNL